MLALLDWTPVLTVVLATVAVAVIMKFLPWVTKAGIEDIIAKQVRPLHDRLSSHLDDEERELRTIHERLQRIDDRKQDEHVRLWNAIEELRRR